jgi:ornithine decarboxylase
MMKWGVIKTSRAHFKHANDNQRWFIDVGNLADCETMDEAFAIPIQRQDKDAKSPCVIAGPTCDSRFAMKKTPMICRSL